ncbi:MAG: UDP-N-acetylmuramate dehydrogenase [Spirochaetaceae bacterium]|jgi:UDP-N-acetylmuramate dehydrogenase|nr:UDP-N-acetylmuramate dehydrogenase [Spirochaetaceae bacterium]
MADISVFRRLMEKISREPGFSGEFRFAEPMATHTTFKVGGPADLWMRPDPACFPECAGALLALAREEGVPVFVLGGGANIVVSDLGIRGAVLDTGAWTGWEFQGAGGDAAVTVRAGTTMDALVDAAAGQGRGGLEFLSGMPGTLGGAVWMNARCMEKSISDTLVETEITGVSGGRLTIPYREGDFSYKKSPFQNQEAVILSAKFRVYEKEPEEIRREAEKLRKDRAGKGHYRAPSAGSAFKNNRAFGKPTGKLIDELGLLGFSAGGAAVAPWHGNLIINTGNAAARDIRALVNAVTEKVRASLGFDLEPEILFVGEWD